MKKSAIFSSESISRRKMEMLLVSLLSAISELKMIAVLQIGFVVFLLYDTSDIRISYMVVLCFRNSQYSDILELYKSL